MSISINDELANKIFHLSKALESAKKAIHFLEIQNSCLKDAFANLASLNKEDYANCLEDHSGSDISV